MRHDAAAEPQHLVADGAALYEDSFLLDHVDEERVLVEAEAVADAAGAEEEGVEEVFVDAVAVAEGFARVEEEGDVDAFDGALFAEPEEFWEERGEGAAGVFLADEVEAAD